MAYKVILSDRALQQLDEFTSYLLFELRNEEAASALLDDALDAADSLSYVAASLPLCADAELKRRGLRRFLFSKHRYLWLYQIKGDTVFVKAMYHELQDYDNLFKNGE